MRTYNEQTAVTVTITVTDVDGNAYTPSTARYRVDDCKTGNSMVTWTDVTPSSSITITIPGSVNIIENSRNRKEEKVVTLNTDRGQDTEVNEDYSYHVKNLKFVT